MADDAAPLLVVSADLQKLEKAFLNAEARVNKSLNKIEKRAHDSEHKIAEAFGKGNIGEALTKVFDRSRFAVLEEGGARIGLFGSALETLGAAGLVAAGGLFAAHEILEKTEGAVEYAADIGKLAKTVGVSTDFIQEFNFALKQSEVDVGAGDEALKRLNESLGAVQGNLPRAKQIAVTLKAIGFTPEQLRGYKNAGDLFPVLIGRIAELSSVAERAAIAKKLGIEELLPLINKGAAAFAAMTQRARDLGIVMDASLIRKGEEAKEKLNELDQIMKAKTNITFAEFAGTLVKIKEAFAAAELAGLRFLAAITGTTPARDVIRETLDQLHNLQAQDAASGRVAPSHVDLYRSIAARLRKAAADVRKEDADAAADEPKAGDAKQLVPDKTPKAKKGDAAARATEAAEALDEGTKAYLQASAALTANIEKHAQFEKDAIDAETAKKGLELTAKADKIKADKSIGAAARRTELAQIELARIGEQEAAIAKKALIDRRAAEDLASQDLEERSQIVGDYNEVDRINAQLAATAKERIKFDARALAAEQRIARAKEKLALDAEVASGRLPQSGADAQLASGDDLRAAQRAQFARQNEGPLQAFARENTLTPQGALESGAKGAASAMKELSSGLAQAAVDGRDLADVAKGVFKKIAADMLEQLISNAEAKLLKTAASFLGIPGFAGGTDNAPGGPAIVGERGPEIVNLPRGSTVTPNSALRALKTSPVRAGGPGAINLSVHVDAGGAIPREEIEGMVYRGATTAIRAARGQAAADAKAATPATLRQHQRLRA